MRAGTPLGCLQTQLAQPVRYPRPASYVLLLRCLCCLTARVLPVLRPRMVAQGSSAGQQDDRLGTFAYAAPEVLLGEPAIEKAVSKGAMLRGKPGG